MPAQAARAQWPSSPILPPASSSWWPRRMPASTSLARAAGRRRSGSTNRESFQPATGEAFIHIHNPRAAAGDHRRGAHCASRCPRWPGRPAMTSPSSIRAAPSPRTSGFPASTLHADWPDEVLPGHRRWMRARRFIALTHDPKIDDPALTLALKSECFYIGALGSQENPRLARHERLKAAGLDPIPHPRPHRPRHRGARCAGDRHLHHGRDDPQLRPWRSGKPDELRRDRCQCGAGCHPCPFGAPGRGVASRRAGSCLPADVAR